MSPSHAPLRKKDGPTSRTPNKYLYLKNVSSASQHVPHPQQQQVIAVVDSSTRELTATSTHHTGFWTREGTTNQHQSSTLESSEMYAYCRVLVCTSLSMIQIFDCAIYVDHQNCRPASLRLHDTPTLSNCKSPTESKSSTTKETPRLWNERRTQHLVSRHVELSRLRGASTNQIHDSCV